jgi:hypothetical protein
MDVYNTLPLMLGGAVWQFTFAVHLASEQTAGQHSDSASDAQHLIKVEMSAVNSTIVTPPIDRPVCTVWRQLQMPQP